MSSIRTIYSPHNGKPQQPKFDATDQHPAAVRYLVGDYYVDAIGGEPTLEEVDAVLNPPAPAEMTKADILAQLKHLIEVVEALQ